MRIFIAGMDGYLGWALTLYLAKAGHEVAGCDTFLRRDWVTEIGSQSATPIKEMTERLSVAQEIIGRRIYFRLGDLRNYIFLHKILSEFMPDAIVHLAEQPSAPYSMIDLDHAIFTQANNIIGTLSLLFAINEVCPDTHLVKLGTMGEYGTPNIPIPEGFFTIRYRGKKDTLPFPRQAGSWYHLSKVHDSQNIMFACKAWGLRSTDLMQGPVYGTRTYETDIDDRLVTRFDFDEVFGTALNRFCAQAVIGFPLTPYGKGHQARGFINLIDSMRCIELSILNPPEHGEYRVFNQFTEIFTMNQLALAVQKAGRRMGLTVLVDPIKIDPRVEAEEHVYDADHQKLIDLGLQPHLMEYALEGMLEDLSRWRDRILAKQDHILPTIYWSKEKERLARKCKVESSV